MTEPDPLPVEVTDGTVTLESHESRVEVIGVTGLVAAVIVGLVGIVVLSFVDRSIPDSLSAVVGAAAGALAMRIRGDRP